MTAEMRDTSLDAASSDVDSPTPVRVALFSNQELIGAGLATLLERFPERAVRSESSGNGIGQDVIVFDLVSAVGQARAPALRQLRELIGDHHVVVAVTRDATDDLATRARALGCAAVVPVTTSAEELVEVLEGVAGHRRTQGPATHRVLTKRETQIVELVARGLSNTEIARELFLSVNSVKTYIRTAYRKMGVTTRSQAVLWAVRGGLAGDRRYEPRQDPPAQG